jgi:hypothetical protein
VLADEESGLVSDSGVKTGSGPGVIEFGRVERVAYEHRLSASSTLALFM